MKRTTIMAEEELLLELQHLARRRKTTAASVVREALAEYVARHRARGQLPSFTGVGDSGRSDIAERMEELIEEEARRGQSFH